MDPPLRSPLADDATLDSSYADEESVIALKKANIGYAALFLLIAILCLVLKNTGHSWLGKILKPQPADLGLSLVCRTTFAGAIFYLAHCVAMVGNKNLVDSCRFILHTRWPFLHWLLFLALFIACWFVPQGVFDAYLQFAYAASGLYLFLQLIFLIDFFHMLNEKYAPSEDACSCHLVLVVTIVLTLASIGGFVASFILFHDKGTDATVVCSVNLAACVLVFVASLCIEHGSIFTASLVCAYVSFLTFSGSLCRWPLANTSSNEKLSLAISIIFAVITLTWTGYSAFSTTAQFGDTCSCGPEGEERPFSLWFFHFIFMLATIYLTMLTSNWGTGEQKAWTVDRGSIASWVAFISAWLSLVLYAWTIFAPLICTGRDFS